MTYYTLIIVKKEIEIFRRNAEFNYQANFDLDFTHFISETEITQSLVDKIFALRKNNDLIAEWGIDARWYDALRHANTTMFDGNDDNLFFEVEGTYRLVEAIITYTKDNVLEYFTENEWKVLAEIKRILNGAFFDGNKLLQFRCEFT